MTLGDIKAAVLSLCETRPKNLFAETTIDGVTTSPIDVWVNAEISNIISRQRYWWRKKLLTFQSIEGLRQGYVNLTTGQAGGFLSPDYLGEHIIPNQNIAPDFEQLLNLYWIENIGQEHKLELKECIVLHVLLILKEV